MKSIPRASLVAVGLFAAFTLPTFAHDAGLKIKARDFGIAMGNAHTCAPDDEKHSIKSASSDVYRTAVFHHGIDLAYEYAVAVGFGAAMDKADLDCAAVLEHINDIKAKMGLGEAK